MMFGNLVDAALQLLSGQPTRDMEAEAKRQEAEAMEHLAVYNRGWRDWSRLYAYMDRDEPTPYDYERVWIWRREWDMPKAVEPRYLDPQMNVIGLLWKPWRESEAKLLQLKRDS